MFLYIKVEKNIYIEEIINKYIYIDCKQTKIKNMALHRLRIQAYFYLCSLSFGAEA